jgi:hypothetical protein
MPGQPSYPVSTASTNPNPLEHQIRSSYTGSYALLIGESKYTHGWSNLESIPGELQQVESLLKSKSKLLGVQTLVWQTQPN